MERKARIYRPAKTAMQSGRNKTKTWFLEYANNAAFTPDALMGWPTMKDTLPQVKLQFANAEEAVAYANAKGIAYELVEPNLTQPKPKSYAANFAPGRRK